MVFSLGDNIIMNMSIISFCANNHVTLITVQEKLYLRANGMYSIYNVLFTSPRTTNIANYYVIS